jgi:hypothetical protein
MEAWQVAACEAIRHTIASYTHFADRGKFDLVADLFAVDGVLDVEGIGGARAEGRAAIEAFFGGVNNDVVNAQEPPPGRMQHPVASIYIDVTSPVAATSTAYFTVMTGAGVDHWGTYRDTWVPDGDRWLFQLRRVRTDGRTPGGWADARA